MNLSAKELEYLEFVLHCASPFTINRGEQEIAPGVNHNEVKEKIKMYSQRLHW